MELHAIVKQISEIHSLNQTNLIVEKEKMI